MTNNTFQFIVREDEEKPNRYYLMARTTFKYKGKEQEAVSQSILKDYKKGDKIQKEKQQELMKEIAYQINKYKIEH